MWSTLSITITKYVKIYTEIYTRLMKKRYTEEMKYDLNK